MEEILEKIDTSHQKICCREEYAEMARYLSDLAEGVGLNKKKSSKDYYLKRSYILLKSEGSDDFLVSKKVYNDATDLDGKVGMMKIKKFYPEEDVFSVICSHHLMKGHTGACTTKESMMNSYSNTPMTHVQNYWTYANSESISIYQITWKESPQSS
jgi:hypothetical protein